LYVAVLKSHAVIPLRCPPPLFPKALALFFCDTFPAPDSGSPQREPPFLRFFFRLAMLCDFFGSFFESDYSLAFRHCVLEGPDPIPCTNIPRLGLSLYSGSPFTFFLDKFLKVDILFCPFSFGRLDSGRVQLNLGFDSQTPGSYITSSRLSFFVRRVFTFFVFTATGLPPFVGQSLLFFLLILFLLC